MKKIILSISLSLYSFIFFGQEVCFEQLTLNNSIDIKSVFTVASASEVKKALKIDDWTTKITEDILGDILELKTEGLYLRYYEMRSDHFVLTEIEISSSNYELRVNSSTLKKDKELNQELKKQIAEFHNKYSCEFVSIKLEVNEQNQIKKIKLFRRVT